MKIQYIFRNIFSIASLKDQPYKVVFRRLAMILGIQKDSNLLDLTEADELCVCHLALLSHFGDK